MGVYVSTTTSLATRMIGVTFDTATTALATEIIADAEAEVNKYLAKRYDVSSFQTTVPPLVRSLATRLAEAYMWRSMSRGSKESLARAAAMEKPVIENLALIADYKATLTDSAGSAIVDSSNTSYAIKCNTTGYTPTFAEDSELNWRVDSDKLDDIANERK